jgi:hypothetical protein
VPLSSVIGASSILKPGVCTSLTRPAAPYEGQTIYETDTDLVKSWDGSSWVTIGPYTPTLTPGLVLITGKTTFTNVASVSLANNTFTSTYDNYRVMITLEQAATSTITARFRASGTDTTTSYYWGQTNSRFNSTSSVYGGDNQSSIRLGFAIQEAFSFKMDVMSPKRAERTRLIYQGWSADPTPTYSGDMVGSGLQYSDTVYDSMTFLGSANISGFYTVYGYNQ